MSCNIVADIRNMPDDRCYVILQNYFAALVDDIRKTLPKLTRSVKRQATPIFQKKELANDHLRLQRTGSNDPPIMCMKQQINDLMDKLGGKDLRTSDVSIL